MVISNGSKTSKSKGNVVQADEVADTARSRHGPMRSLPRRRNGTSTGIDAGVEDFILGRVYRFATRHVRLLMERGRWFSRYQNLRKLHQTLKKITEDFDSRWHFNSSIAAIMELVNELYHQRRR